MKPFSNDRVFVEFRDDVTAKDPILGRKYTVTHSDDTADIYVTVGLAFAEDKFSPIRDELLLSFRYLNRQMQLFGSVLIDSEEFEGDSAMRTEIFLREIPNALRAIRYADRDFFEVYPGLDLLPIYIWFQSQNDEFNQLYDFGTMRDYALEYE